MELYIVLPILLIVALVIVDAFVAWKRRGHSLYGLSKQHTYHIEDGHLPPELVAEFEEFLRRAESITYPDPMQPPWEVMPGVPLISIGWRMGGGEDYMDAFRAWFGNLSDSDRAKYMSDNPEPGGWAGFYDRTAGARPIPD